MGLHRQIEGTGHASTAPTSASAPPTPAPAPGLGWVPDDRGIYATPVRRGEPPAAAGHPRRAPGPLEQVYEYVPGAARARATSRAPSCPAASSRCSPWPGCCACGARLLLLDEPSEGLAPVIVQRIGEIIRDDQGAGRLGAPRRAERHASPRRSPTATTCSRRAGSSSRLDNDEFQARQRRAARPTSACEPRPLPPRTIAHQTAPSPDRPPHHRTRRPHDPQHGPRHDRRRRRRRLAASPRAAGPAARSPAASKLTDDKVVIGLLNDQSGVYKDLSGPNSQGRHPDGDRRLQGQVRRQGGRQGHRDRHGRPPEQARHRQHQGAGDVRPAEGRHHPRRADLVGRARRRDAGQGEEEAATSTSVPARPR